MDIRPRKEVPFRNIIEMITRVRIKTFTAKRLRHIDSFYDLHFCTVYLPFGKPARNPERESQQKYTVEISEAILDAMPCPAYRNETYKTQRKYKKPRL